MRSVWILCAVLGLILSAGALPAQAGYDWCSVDPTITFQRAGSRLAHVMDVQVMVPLSALPIAGTARLGVTMPSNVAGTEVLNTSTPLFQIKTTFAQSVVPAASDSYAIKLSLKMPRTTTDYPVRLVAVNQSTKQFIVIKEGMASQLLTTTVNSADLLTLLGL
jgi:hypothetical protein